jgi:urease subunit alpha
MTMDPRQYAAIYGPTTGDRVQLGDTGLAAQVNADDSLRGEEFLLRFGKTGRDGMHMAALPRRRPATW